MYARIESNRGRMARVGIAVAKKASPARRVHSISAEHPVLYIIKGEALRHAVQTTQCAWRGLGHRCDTVVIQSGKKVRAAKG